MAENIAANTSIVEAVFKVRLLNFTKDHSNPHLFNKP
jgi:hypothetical protein